MTVNDEVKRPRTGLVAYLQDMGNGKSKLTFKDVVPGSEQDQEAWIVRVPYTSNEYDNDALNEMKLSDRDHMQIGENLLVRLLALDGRIK